MNLLSTLISSRIVRVISKAALLASLLTSIECSALTPIVDKYIGITPWFFVPDNHKATETPPNPWQDFDGWYSYQEEHEVTPGNFDEWWSSIPNNDDIILALTTPNDEEMMTIAMGYQNISYYYRDENDNIFVARNVSPPGGPSYTCPGNYALYNRDTGTIYYVDENGIDYVSNDGFHFIMNDAGIGIQIEGTPPGY